MFSPGKTMLATFVNRHWHYFAESIEGVRDGSIGEHTRPPPLSDGYNYFASRFETARKVVDRAQEDPGYSKCLEAILQDPLVMVMLCERAYDQAAPRPTPSEAALVEDLLKVASSRLKYHEGEGAWGLDTSALLRMASQACRSLQDSTRAGVPEAVAAAAACLSWKRPTFGAAV